MHIHDHHLPSSTNKKQVTRSFAVRITRRDKMRDFLHATAGTTSTAVQQPEQQPFTFNRRSRGVRNVDLRALEAFLPTQEHLTGSYISKCTRLRHIKNRTRIGLDCSKHRGVQGSRIPPTTSRDVFNLLFIALRTPITREMSRSRSCPTSTTSRFAFIWLGCSENSINYNNFL